MGTDTLEAPRGESDSLANLTDEALAQYRKIVHATMSGESIDRATVCEALTLAGKTPADVERDVQACRKRKAAREQLKSADALDKEFAQLRASCYEKAAQLQAFQNESGQKIAAMDRELFGLQNQLSPLQAQAFEMRTEATKFLARTANDSQFDLQEI